MGIVIVLVFWAIIGTILAGIGGLILGGAAGFVTRGAQRGRRKVMLAAALFPFVCLAWAGTVFVFQAVINETLLHRDADLGDTRRCPLPNGYALMMIDVTDQGWVYNPKTQSGDSVGEQEDAVPGVRTVQVAGRYILGASDSKWFGRLGDEGNHVDSFFLMDTQAGKRTTFPSYETLAIEAQRLGIQPKLEPINALYSKYRFTKFDVFVGFLLCLPPMVATCLLALWIARVRRTREAAAEATKLSELSM
jgi:hypothetical protein